MPHSINLKFLGLAWAALPLLVSAPAYALQEGLLENEATSSTPASQGAPAAFAVWTEESISVDGRLDEEIWSQITPATGFLQSRPTEGIPAEYDSKVWVVFTDNAVHVAALLLDPDPSSVADQLLRRDQRGQADWFAVQFDPNRDRRTGYSFEVSAANVQRDAYLFNDQGEDFAWNAVWQSATGRSAEGWVVEIRIPLSQMRYETDEPIQTWGVNFVRRRTVTDEISYFSLRSRLVEGRVSQFGLLENVRVPGGARRIEARPYLLGSLDRSQFQDGDPFYDGSEANARVGVDLRFGLGSAFTLDATLNPDFGQVESDPAVINLSAFEVFLPEQRPFFIEDAQVLDFSLSGRQNGLFYSRRIGRSPQGGAPGDALFSDVPTAAKILGAAKLTGRTVGGLSLGALFAVTDRESGRALVPTPGNEASIGQPEVQAFTAEPQAEYAVTRVQQDFREGRTQFGVMTTAMRRSLPADGSFDFLSSSAFSGGVNFEHQWSGRDWGLTGFLALSQVRGDSTAMIRVQRANNQLFHRPDATRMAMDSTRTSLSGLEWRLQLDKRNGEHWTGGLWMGQVTPGFEVNDLGFSQNSERLDGGFRVGYREIQPSRIFQNYDLSFFTFHNWSHEALDNASSWDSWRSAHMRGSFTLNASTQLTNWWNLSSNVSLNPDTYSRSLTRGGPVMMDPGSTSASFRFNTDRRKKVTVGLGTTWREGFRDSGGQFEMNGSIEMRPSPRIEVRLEPSWSRQKDGSQYVLATSTLPYAPTFGRRYLFGEIERTTVSMETRVDVGFSPNLTFQLFAQPLLSSGEYLRYRQLRERATFDFVDFQPGTAQLVDGQVRCQGGTICAQPGAEGTQRQFVDFDGDGQVDYNFNDRDFNIRSLVGNAVLRWEFQPGSTFFLVWQRRQRSTLGLGNFDFARDLDGLIGAPADNVFMVKLSYWTSL